MKAIVIAGTVSGVGKTTIATGLMGALHRRGLKVQPFKAGPDYIDPSYHTWATGQASRNLDTWMLPRGSVLELFRRAMAGKDVGVVEGVMGLFDGRTATGDESSTAELAKLLEAPVLLVVDSRKGARSIAAMVSGYQSFDRNLRLAGVILNGIGSEGHLAFCREAIEHYTGLKVLGYLPHQDGLSLPERHLGLVPMVEGPAGHEYLERLIGQIEATFNVDEIIRLAEANTTQVEPKLFPDVKKRAVVRLAIARDKAFSFYYQDNLDLLEAWGAELAPFSPLEDAQLPKGISGIYIGGGFPELYAAELSANKAMREAINSAAIRGMPVYGECGGLMYLGTRIRDFEGRIFPMVGAIPVSSRMDNHRLSLGYRTIRALADGPLLPRGETARGHEFHWSVSDKKPERSPAYVITDTEEVPEGFQTGNLLASYVHLHFGHSSRMAPRMVSVCQRYCPPAQ